MLQISQFITFAKITFEILKALYRLINRLKKRPLTGILCTCWQHDESQKTEYEVGSIRMYQWGDKVIGEIYCGDRMWPFRGKFLHGILKGDYEEWSGFKAHFELTPADEGKNFDRLQGKWSGSTEVNEKVKKATDLRFYAARGNYRRMYCHVKMFKKDRKNIGVCLKNE